MQKIAIIGGGIGGLCTAIALQRHTPHQVIVYESAAEIKNVGAGLLLAANALKALDYIGIKKEVLSVGHLQNTFAIIDQNGKIITKTNRERIAAKFDTEDNFAVHRAELHKCLMAQLKPNTLQLNSRCIEVVQTEGKVKAVITEGDQPYTISFDALIAADGIHSVVRKKYAPDSQIRYAGYTCWRGVTTNPIANYNTTSETWGKNGRFGIVPLKDGRVYWFLVMNNPTANDPAMQALNLTDLYLHFKDYHYPIPQILQATQANQFIWNDIIDLKPINQYAYNQVLLLGDAAHATTPNMGQGACQAIEDAAVLLNCIRQQPNNIAQAFTNFEQKRLKRTHAVVNNSWILGKLAQIQNPMLIALRNFCLRLVPQSFNEKQLDFIYKVEMW